MGPKTACSELHVSVSVFYFEEFFHKNQSAASNETMAHGAISQ